MTGQGLSGGPFSAWPLNAQCKFRVDKRDKAAAADASAPAPAETGGVGEVTFLCEELLGPTCVASGDDTPYDHTVTPGGRGFHAHLAQILDCRDLLSLPLRIFGLGPQRLSMTIVAPGLQESEHAQMRMEADIEGLKFTDTRVIDCFMFNDEVDMLELRLANHDSFVDSFVIIESPTTHSGHEKRLVFDMVKHLPRFQEFAHKIVHRVVGDKQRSDSGMEYVTSFKEYVKSDNSREYVIRIPYLLLLTYSNNPGAAWWVTHVD